MGRFKKLKKLKHKTWIATCALMIGCALGCLYPIIGIIYLGSFIGEEPNTLILIIEFFFFISVIIFGFYSIRKVSIIQKKDK